MTSIRATPSTMDQLDGRKIEFIVFCIGVLLFLIIPRKMGCLVQNWYKIVMVQKKEKEITV